MAHQRTAAFYECRNPRQIEWEGFDSAIWFAIEEVARERKRLLQWYGLNPDKSEHLQRRNHALAALDRLRETFVKRRQEEAELVTYGHTEIEPGPPGYGP